ncbi:MAG: DsrE family protein [Sphingopyxis sp.]|uniref:DsrE family protein n=1 Tax=Sphingopyxis sp. TaxID=1908224 RepID=UPI002AB99A5E|nr:DsrE family protein [Sphingopyxis sp.]MDZ3830612.1 DsrE family protein [Sphingopyxis sp.]
MPGLNIIVAAPDGARFYAALECAMAWSALGRTARLFLQGEAAALLQAPVGFPGDRARTAAGQPDLAALVAEAAAMDVRIMVCQSGLALAGVTADRLAPEAEVGGLLSFLAATAPDDHLLTY